MKIIGASWTVEVNMLKIACSCGIRFKHRADVWNVECPKCGTRAHLKVLRERIRKGDVK